VISFPTEDCQLRAKVFVDEPVPDSVAKKSPKNAPVITSLLKVPGGKLIADGIEFMVFPGQSRKESDAFCFEVAPGIYRLQAYDLLRWKQKNWKAEFKRRTTAPGRFLNQLNNAITIMAVIILVLGLIALPAVTLWVWKHSSGWAALKVLGIMAVVYAITVGYFCLLNLLQKRFAVFRQGLDVRQAFDRENPDLVIALFREPGGAVQNVEPAFLKVSV
jgi:hypothetical protein